MLANITFDNEKISQLTQRMRELLRELDSVTMQLRCAIEIKVEDEKSK